MVLRRRGSSELIREHLAEGKKRSGGKQSTFVVRMSFRELRVGDRTDRKARGARKLQMNA